VDLPVLERTLGNISSAIGWIETYETGVCIGYTGVVPSGDDGSFSG
jgi:hypothetical protein